MKFDTLGLISKLVKFESVSADSSKAACARECAEFLSRTLAGLGFDSELMETGGNPVVFARRNCASGRPRARVLCYGHYDVQPADPLGKWKTPPFEPTVKDGKIWGRGTADNKGPFSCLHTKGTMGRAGALRREQRPLAQLSPHNVSNHKHDIPIWNY